MLLCFVHRGRREWMYSVRMCDCGIVCGVKKKCRVDEARGICDDMMRNLDEREWDEDVELLR